MTAGVTTLINAGGEKVLANNDDKKVSQDEIDAYIEAQYKED